MHDIVKSPNLEIFMQILQVRIVVLHVDGRTYTRELTVALQNLLPTNP